MKQRRTSIAADIITVFTRVAVSRPAAKCTRGGKKKKKKKKKTPAEEKKKEERKINFLDVYTLLREEFLFLFHARVVDACYRESAGVSARSVRC